MRELQRAHGGHAAFLFIHIKEAGHRISELTSVYRDAALDASSPADRPRRIARAMQHYGLTFPCLLDTEDGRVRRAYGAWPERLVIVDRDGRIALDAGAGLTLPLGLRPGAVAPGLPPTHWDFDAIDGWLRDHTAAKTVAAARASGDGRAGVQQ